MKKWPEFQSVEDIQVFLCFTNFYRRVIRNFSRIAKPFTLMLQITNDEALNTQATEIKKNQDISAGVGSGFACGGVGRSIKNLSITAKLAKSKKPKLTNLEIDFHTFEAKKNFTHL